MNDFDVSQVRRGLLVFVPGLPRKERRGNTSPPYAELLSRLQARVGGAWRVVQYRHDQSATSRADLDEVVGDLAAHIRQWSGEIGDDVETPDAILLVGHSFGGVLLRAAFIRDAGDGGTEGMRPWVRKVRRIVLLGTPNSGFRWNAKGSPLLWRLAYLFATPFADFAVEKVEAGGYWITDLRLRWLDVFRRMDHPPRVAQVLGTRDDLVQREDILDARFMPNTVEIDIPGANHAGLIDLSKAPNPDERFSQLSAAIVGRSDESVPPLKKPAKVPTFFILHGIRASAYENWVHEISDAIAARPENAGARIVRPDTGFFSAAEFALPGTRKRKIHEFLKLYGDAYAAGDPDEFAFAGHSNGTYMMARSLDRVPAMRFKRIYLAGTVLPRNFDWWGSLERRQVGSFESNVWLPGLVRNDRATKDVPVGILCSWLRGLGSNDVGTAGIDGFVHAPAEVLDGPRAYDGGHGAALLTPERLAAIASFLTDGSGDPPPPGGSTGGFRWFSRFAGNRIIAWTLLLIILAILAAVFVVIGILWLGWWSAAVAAGVAVLLVVLLRTI